MRMRWFRKHPDGYKMRLTWGLYFHDDFGKKEDLLRNIPIWIRQLWYKVNGR